jgi:hypothetical protein
VPAPPPATAQATLSRTPAIPANSPLYELQLSTDGGSTWSTVNTGITGLGNFTTSSCKGTGSSAVCIAGGSRGGMFTDGGAIVVSIDGGATWTIPTLPVGAYSKVLGVDCTGAGATAVCAAGGFYEDSGNPFLVASSDGGATWQLKAPMATEACFIGSCQAFAPGTTWPDYYQIETVPLTGQAAITGISCLGSPPSASCYASALSYAGLDYPIVLTSTDGAANNWTLAGGVPATQREIFLGIGCAPVASSVTCVAVGQLGTGANGGSTEVPVIALSTDGGVTWTFQNPPAPPSDSAWYSAVTHTGSGANIVWTATGTAYVQGSGQVTITATSSDGGATWQ